MELKHRRHLQPADTGTLLIVPYGIETQLPPDASHGIYPLLIVPYGIETFQFFLVLFSSLPFNRTLWN